jgi:hypothetical protein
VAGICAEKKTANGEVHPVTFNIPLDFLGGGSYKMTSFTDGDKQEKIVVNHDVVKKSKTLTIPCLSEGGFLLKLQK